jgi:hypothetical protein
VYDYHPEVNPQKNNLQPIQYAGIKISTLGFNTKLMQENRYINKSLLLVNFSFCS